MSAPAFSMTTVKDVLKQAGLHPLPSTARSSRPGIRLRQSGATGINVVVEVGSEDLAHELTKRIRAALARREDLQVSQPTDSPTVLRVEQANRG